MYILVLQTLRGKTSNWNSRAIEDKTWLLLTPCVLLWQCYAFSVWCSLRWMPWGSSYYILSMEAFSL